MEIFFIPPPRKQKIFIILPYILYPNILYRKNGKYIRFLGDRYRNIDGEYFLEKKKKMKFFKMDKYNNNFSK